jgi:hypothetical protein
MCQNLDLRFLPFIAFCQVFSLPLFRFFDLAFYCLLSFFLFDFFIALCFLLIFHSCFVPVFFFAPVVSSLAYPNLLGNKRLGCCCCCKSSTRLPRHSVSTRPPLSKGGALSETRIRGFVSDWRAAMPVRGSGGGADTAPGGGLAQAVAAPPHYRG